MPVNRSFLLSRDQLRSASESVLQNMVLTWLERVNPTCLLHPHGFYVALLGRNEVEEWRFHFWPSTFRTTLGMPANIHTHDRHVESRILQGQLTNILYDVPETLVGGQPIYSVRYEGDRYLSGTSNCLYKSNTRGLPVIQQSVTMKRGDFYQVERHAYHEAVVPDQLATATLVCMHSQSAGEVRVVGVDGYPETVSFQRSQVRADTFTKLLFL